MMKTTPLVAGLFLAIFATTGTLHAGLISNPGNDLDLVGGEIPSWTEVVGSNWTQRTGSPTPQSGRAYFFAGAGANAELSQTIDVSGLSTSIDAGAQQFDFSGFVQSFSQGNADSSRIVLEYQDSAGGVLAAFDTGDIVDTTGWQEVTDSRLAPALTRSIEVRLIAVRHAGTNNDGYFDTLSLTTTAVPEPSALMLTGIVGLIAMTFARKR